MNDKKNGNLVVPILPIGEEYAMSNNRNAHHNEWGGKNNTWGNRNKKKKQP